MSDFLVEECAELRRQLGQARAEMRRTERTIRETLDAPVWRRGSLASDLRAQLERSRATLERLAASDDVD